MIPHGTVGHELLFAALSFQTRFVLMPHKFASEVLLVLYFVVRVIMDMCSCRMDLSGPTTSVGARTDYSVGP
jgi:hypothetical protein